jgi:hypothetical protein
MNNNSSSDRHKQWHDPHAENSLAWPLLAVLRVFKAVSIDRRITNYVFRQKYTGTIGRCSSALFLVVRGLLFSFCHGKKDLRSQPSVFIPVALFDRSTRLLGRAQITRTNGRSTDTTILTFEIRAFFRRKKSRYDDDR